ncbi:MAG: tetratricopeptide repeat protein [FCB group bacterium]|nr:tetratricopeptide repeat protein [FCB group bacterium]
MPVKRSNCAAADVLRLVEETASLRKAGAISKAESLAKYSLTEYPDSIELKDQLGQIYRETKRYDEAIGIYKEILQGDPGYAGAYFNLALTLQSAGRPENACKWYELSLQQNPKLWQAWFNLGSLHRKRENWEAAIYSYQKTLELNPQLAEVYDYLGRIYRDTDRLTEAEAILLEGINVSPLRASLYNTLGQVYFKLGAYDRALQRYHTALQLDPEFSEAKFSRSLTELKLGDFRNGFNDYQYRLTLKENRTRNYKGPEWEGEDLSGKVLLVHWEQGLGDTLQFIRYLNLLPSFGCRVIFECQSSLIPLLKGFEGYDMILPAGADLPDYDAHISLLSLPRIFRTDIETIPAIVPYLQADAELKQRWQFLLRDGGFRVGINWQGNLEVPTGRLRSFPLALFSRLAEIPDITWYSLQKLDDNEKLHDMPWLKQFDQDFDHSAGPFMDTAAVMSHLDLIISCDTSIAHLAGALGCRVWVVLPYSADWRWFIDRRDSPWYPTMRLFRQPTIGDWDSAFDEIKTELIKLTAAR